MTREIKFRAKKIDNNEFVIGYYLPMVERYKKHFIYLPLEFFSVYSRFEIDSKTLGQYTGLNDKNGKEIYEGDIVKIMQETETFFDKVIYDNHLCSFRFEGLSDYCDFCDWLREGAEFEVVGNIYENPELIGDKND